MDASFELHAGGFILRRWRRDDLPALVRHADDAEVARRVSDRFPHPYTQADGIAFLEGRVVDLSQPVLAIEIDGQACGGIGARVGAGERLHSAELGYWLARAHWGRGLMTQAVATYLPWVIAHYQLMRVQAFTLDFNAASARVLRKSGFEEEGVERRAVIKHGQLHDLRRFALLP
ncbi:MAG: GNAT family protein [Pseudoxanthomonas sp.]